MTYEDFLNRFDEFSYICASIYRFESDFYEIDHFNKTIKMITHNNQLLVSNENTVSEN